MDKDDKQELVYVPVGYIQIPKKVVTVNGVKFHAYRKETYEDVLKSTNLYARTDKNIKRFLDAGIDPEKKKKCFMCKELRCNAYFPFSETKRHFICRACSKFDYEGAAILHRRIEELLAQKQKSNHDLTK